MAGTTLQLHIFLYKAKTAEISAVFLKPACKKTAGLQIWRDPVQLGGS